MGYARANLFCKSENMVLPRPGNDAENANMAERFGQTWVNVLVNAILDEDRSYGNWQRRLRGYLNADKTWSVVPASEERTFYCVDKGEQKDSCKAQLSDLAESGNWSYASRGSNLFSRLAGSGMLNSRSIHQHITPI